MHYVITLCGVSSAGRSDEEIHRIAGTSENVPVRMKKNILSVIRGTESAQLTFKNTVSMKLGEDHVDHEAKELSIQNWRFLVSGYPDRNTA